MGQVQATPADEVPVPVLPPTEQQSQLLEQPVDIIGLVWKLSVHFHEHLGQKIYLLTNLISKN
jgi:hypothetical protein